MYCMRCAFMMKCLILYILFNIIYLGISENDTYDCWEKHNLFITIDDLPSLLKHFTICLAKCQLKNNECFLIASQLKSSISVLRELYYNGQISFWITQDYNDLYNKVINLYSIHPKLIPNWLVIKNEIYPISYDMEVMLSNGEEQICNKLIILSKELDNYGVVQLIPIPSFDDDINPQYLILPYKADFLININNTYENAIIYKIYFQSMKCMNIINDNLLKVNLLNTNFKHWIINKVIPIAISVPKILPGFGGIYRVLNLAEEFDKSGTEKNYKFKCTKELNKVVGYPNMTYGLIKNNTGSFENCGIFDKINTNALIVFIMIISIIFVLILFCSFNKKWSHIYCNKAMPIFELDNIVDISDNQIKEIYMYPHKLNKWHDKDQKYFFLPSHNRDDKFNSKNSSIQNNNDVMTINSLRYNTLSERDFHVYARRENPSNH